MVASAPIAWRHPCTVEAFQQFGGSRPSLGRRQMKQATH
jgi:hypothetical protein